MIQSDFERFYRSNIDRIYRYVFFRVGRNKTLTEDLVSEIFLKALGAFDHYDETVSKSAWIYRIAHNHLVNHYRDTKETVDIVDVGLSVSDLTGVWVELSEQLERLGKDERQLVTMKYLEGYRYREIAEILNKTEGSVKMAISRIMRTLKLSV